MTSINALTLESADPSGAERFYATAFGTALPLRYAATDAPSSGFRDSPSH